jgi:hypothetical protein
MRGFQFMIFDTAFQRTAYNCGDQIEANVNLLHAITEHVHLTPLAPSTHHFDSPLWRADPNVETVMTTSGLCECIFTSMLIKIIHEASTFD